MDITIITLKGVVIETSDFVTFCQRGVISTHPFLLLTHPSNLSVVGSDELKTIKEHKLTRGV